MSSPALTSTLTTAKAFREIAARSGRLVHPAVAEGRERAAQGALLSSALAAPFLFGSGAAVLLLPHLGLAGAIAAVCATFGAFWLVALGLVVSARRLAVGFTLVGLVAVFSALLVAAAGGPASPLAPLLLAPLVEAALLGRNRRCLLAGLAATFAAIVLLGVFMAWFASAEAAAWQWAVPAAYFGWSLMRRDRTEAAAGGEASEQKRDLLRRVASALVLKLDRTGKVASVDGAAEEILGVAPELLLGDGFLGRVHVGDRLALLCALSDAGKEPKRMEARLRLPAAPGEPDGGFLSPVLLDICLEGDGPAIVLRRNEEVAELKRRLEEAQEKAASLEIAKARFLAAVSHELRTPLNSVIGFSDLLLQGPGRRIEDERQAEYVGLIREAGSHLLELVNAILDASKIESGSYELHIEPFRLKEVADRVVAMMQVQAAAKGVTIETGFSHAVGEIRADRRALQQILLNLLSNAVKFTPRGGTVSVTAGRLGTRVSVSVHDTGIGMTAADLERIGRPFVQVDNDYARRFEGTGLGLSIVKGLVELHEGRMAIDSVPGEGTNVTVSLPARGPAERPDAEREPAVVRIATRTSGGLADGTLSKAG